MENKYSKYTREELMSEIDQLNRSLGMRCELIDKLRAYLPHEEFDILWKEIVKKEKSKQIAYHQKMIDLLTANMTPEQIAELWNLAKTEQQEGE